MERKNLPDDIESMESNSFKPTNKEKQPAFIKKWNDAIVKDKNGEGVDEGPYWKILKGLCYNNLTSHRMQKILGICDSDWWKAMRTCEKFRDIVMYGRDLMCAEVSATQFEAATGFKQEETFIGMDKNGVIHTKEYTKKYPPDYRSAALLLKSHNPELWNKADKHDITVDDNRQVVENAKLLDKISEDVLEALVNDIEKNTDE